MIQRPRPEQQCGARTSAETPCRRWPVRGRARCRLHGGHNPSGLAAPAFKHGRYSKVLPTRLIDRYRAAREDAALLELREELALVDARLGDLLQRVELGEAGSLWRRARASYAAFEDASRRQDTDAVRAALAELGGLLRRGAGDYAAWAEVHACIEQRRRLAEAERKRLEALQATLTAEQALAMFSALTSIIKAHVTDRAALAAISDEIVRLANRPALEAAR